MHAEAQRCLPAACIPIGVCQSDAPCPTRHPPHTLTNPTALPPFRCPGVRAEFPITQDSITTQQLVYLRLARLQDSAQLAKASCVGQGGGEGGLALQHVKQTRKHRLSGWVGSRATTLPTTCCWPTRPFLLPPPTPQIDFEQDTIISQENEYEILQIMMGDLRDRCAAVLARPGWGCSWWGPLTCTPPLF